jgi:hypothetical protein
MDPYASQIIINSRLDDLRAEGARSRAARSAHHRAAPSSLLARLAEMVLAWRSRRPDTATSGRIRRSSTSRPA